MSDLLAGLNPHQKRAVLTESGPLLILAGAGTGKTRVVTYRIAHLIRQGIKPERILAVTFTNKAANEMKSRVTQLIGAKRETVPEVSTFHSLCVKILRRHIEKLGYRPRFVIYARGQQETLARQVLRIVNIPNTALKPSEFLWRVGSWKNQGVPPDSAINVAETDKDHLAAAAFRRYEMELKNRNAVDFDDLLLKTERLLYEFESVRTEEAGRFDHVMVDEYQDTNGSQYRIVQALARDHQNLCVVGDDDQSIYGWRGAEVEHILRFNTDWPSADVVRLEDNYRSTDSIIQLSNRLIAHNKVRNDKSLIAARPNGEKPQIHQYRDEVEEAREVVLDIKRRMDRKEFEPRDYAILFRTNEQPRAFESELRRVKLPYVLIGGMSFFDRREVQDVVAYLRAIDDPDEETGLLRIINTPPRGIGSKTVESLLGVAVKRGESIWRVLQDEDVLKSTGEKSAAAIRRFVGTLKGLQSQIGKKSLVDLLRETLSAVEYGKEIDRIYDQQEDRDARWAAIEEVVNELAAFEQRKGKRAKLSRFIDDLTLNGLDSSTEKDNQLKRNAIALMTYHAAKGLEFRCVYMVGMEEGILPHHRSVEAVDGMAIEEERRLCYVGMTRAEDRLTMTLALTRRKWGKPRETNPSRFLFEIVGKADNPHARAKRPKSKSRRAETSSRGKRSSNSSSKTR